MILRDAKILKNEKRRLLRTIEKRASPVERARSSELLCKLFKAMSGWATCRSILFFAPQSSEPDIWPLIEQAIAEKKTVAFPKFDSDANEYRAAVTESPAHDLKRGKFGVQEPGDACRILDLADLDMILVPGLGFDSTGRRLGRGKGFYDRILAQTTGLAVGLAFDWQLIEEIPTEAHDIPMHRIVTPSRWLPCHEPKKEKRRLAAAVGKTVEAP